MPSTRVHWKSPIRNSRLTERISAIASATAPQSAPWEITLTMFGGDSAAVHRSSASSVPSVTVASVVLVAGVVVVVSSSPQAASAAVASAAAANEARAFRACSYLARIVFTLSAVFRT